MKLDNRPEDFDGVIVKHRRLATLCMLMGPCGGSANEAVIADMLDMAGFRSTREDVRTCLSDLEKLGLSRLIGLKSSLSFA